MDILESGKVAMAGSMPEVLLASMAALHEVVQTIEPIRPPTLDGPLEGGEGTSEIVGDCDEDMESQTDEILQRLKEAAGNTEAAEAAMKGIISESFGNIAKGRGKCRFEPR